MALGSLGGFADLSEYEISNITSGRYEAILLHSGLLFWETILFALRAFQIIFYRHDKYSNKHKWYQDNLEGNLQDTIELF